MPMNHNRTGRTVIPPAIANNEEYHIKVNNAHKAVWLSEVAVIMICIVLATIGQTRPWELTDAVATNQLGNAIAPLLAISGCGIALIIFAAAVCTASTRADDIGVPTWKQVMPFAARHLTTRHVTDAFIIQHPELMTMMPPPSPIQQHFAQVPPQQGQTGQPAGVFGQPGQPQYIQPAGRTQFGPPPDQSQFEPPPGQSLFGPTSGMPQPPSYGQASELPPSYK